MKSALRVLTVSFAFALLLGSPARAENWDARITEIEGEGATVVLAEGAEVPAEKDMPLDEGDKVVAALGTRVEIALEPDSIFEVGPGSEFLIGSLERKNSSFTLNFGSLVAKLRSMLATGGRLEVRTPTAVASVRGTEFGVDVSPEESRTTVGVFDEGKVAVKTPGGPETFLTPRREGEFRPGAAPRIGALSRLQNSGLRERLLRLRGRPAQIRPGWSPLDRSRRRDLRRGLLNRPPKNGKPGRMKVRKEKIRRRFGRQR